MRKAFRHAVALSLLSWSSRRAFMRSTIPARQSASVRG